MSGGSGFAWCHDHGTTGFHSTSVPVRNSAKNYQLQLYHYHLFFSVLLFSFRLPLSSFTAVGTPVAVLSSRLAANAVGRPSFSGWSTCRRNCSGCADSRSLIFSEPAHAVRRRRMWWSIRSSSRFDGAVSYYARTHMMAACAGPPNVDFSDSNFNHVAHVSSRSCGEVEENVLEHARFSWRTPS